MKKTNKVSTAGALMALFLLCVIGGPVRALASGPTPVDLLSASNFVLLSETGITDTGSHSSVITGNIGSSPITAAAMNNIFCSEMNGTIYGVDALYVGSGIQTCFAGNPPLSNKTFVDNAVLDMGTAYNDAAGRASPTAVELGAGNIGGLIIPAGLYKWSTDVTVPTSVTLSGGPNDVWIFQIAGNLTLASAGSVGAGTKIILLGGARASNVFWQVGGVTGATLGTYATFNGNILSAKQVIIQTGAILNGRALAQTQITLDANTISIPTTLHVIKLVVNNISTSTASNFSIHVKSGGIDVAGSPLPGASTPGTPYSLTAGTYTISEDPNSSYNQSFSGACAPSGVVTLQMGDDKTCTIINTDNTLPPGAAAPSGAGSNFAVVPLISITKTPNPLALPEGSGPVTYLYSVTNIGKIAMHGITVTDNKCTPVTYESGDVNGNNLLDINEAWLYTCSKIVSQTETNTATAHGQANGWDAYATAIATVVASSSSPATLENEATTSSTLTPLLPLPVAIIAVPDLATSSDPGLPNTGLPPKNTDASNLLENAAAAIILAAIALALLFLIKKRTARTI